MGAPAAAGGARTNSRCPSLPLPEGGRARSLYRVRVGVCLGVGPEGWLRCFAHPSGGALSAGGMHSTLLLLWALQKWQLGFLVSLYLLSRICPNCACMHVLLVPYSFFAFCCSGRGVSRCKHCSIAAQGSRSQPVSEVPTSDNEFVISCSKRLLFNWKSLLWVLQWHIASIGNIWSLILRSCISVTSSFMLKPK